MSFGYRIKAIIGKRSGASLRCGIVMLSMLATAAPVLVSCADAVGPEPRVVAVPAPQSADERKKGVNENGDPIVYLPLGEDVLMPQTEGGDPLPATIVGPFELRGESLAGALQLILDGSGIPVAFESNSSLNQTITVTDLKGPMSVIVDEVCSLANMYCSFQNGMLTVKDRQIFTVTVPPIVAAADVENLLKNIAAAVGAITGEAPITDASTRTIVYRASQRTSEMARRYFQRLRSNTAMVIYETYIWEVSLDSGNSTGIKWSLFDKIGRFKFGVNVAGAADTNVGTPISIGLPTTGSVDFDTSDVFEFISKYGAVKTISQPQITVLSGSTAKLRVADTQNYLASFTSTTTDGGNTTVSTTTDSVDSGFTLNIGSSWDNSTVYGTIDILLQEVKSIDTFDENPEAVIQLPQTTERELSTSVRVRPGDLLLIAGLVREGDSLNKEGPGMDQPILPSSRTAITSNSELVFLMRPRVVVFTSADNKTPRKAPATDLPVTSFTQPDEKTLSANVNDTVTAPAVLPVDDHTADMDATAPVAAMTAPDEGNLPDVAKESDSVASKSLKANAPDSSSIEIQPLTAAVSPADHTKTPGAPAVIVNYEALGH
jgi:hypothetical protein